VGGEKERNWETLLPTKMREKKGSKKGPELTEKSFWSEV